MECRAGIALRVITEAVLPRRSAAMSRCSDHVVTESVTVSGGESGS